MRPLHIGKALSNLYIAWIESPLGKIFGWGALANFPADGTTGYAKGAMLLDRTNGVPSVNRGTFASCAFRGLGTLPLTTAVSLDLAAYKGRDVVLEVTAASCTITLPAATGSGAKIDVVFDTTGALVIARAGSDTIDGIAFTESDNSAAVLAYTAAGAVSITTDGSTKGGSAAGNRFSLIDAGSTLWNVMAFTTSTGTEATPFA